jgi:hypothetical protein
MRRWIAFGFVAWLAVSTPATAGTTGVLSGYTVDLLCKPQADIDVRIYRWLVRCYSWQLCPSDVSTATTDKHGFYVFISLEPGVYYISASGRHSLVWLPCQGRALVSADQVTMVTLQLTPAIVTTRWPCAKPTTTKPRPSLDVYSVNDLGIAQF